MNKKVINISMLASLILSFQIFAKPIEIKFSHVVAPSTPKGVMAEKFKELAEERLPGKVEIKIYPNSQLFNDDNVLQALQLGDVQMAAPSLSKLDRYTNKLQLFDLPFLFKDMEAVERFQQSESGQELLNSMRSKGIQGLGYLHNGLKQISANEPLRIPSDLRGKSIRIQASDVLQEQYKELEAIPVKKPFSEVFTLLQTKALDGQENTWSNIYSKKFFEVQPYITETNHGVIDYMVVTSTEFWEGLDPDMKNVLSQSLEESINYANKLSSDIAQKSRQGVIDSGRSELIVLSEDERQKWVDSMKPVWNKFEKDIGKNLIDAALNSNK